MRVIATPTDVVTRSRLESRLDACLERRLGLLVAGAGFGKSTLLAAWGRDKWVAWYTLGEADEAAPWLTRGILRALERAGLAADGDYPGGVERVVGTRTRASARGQAHAQASLLCELLDARLEADLILVLDDVHQVTAGTSGAELIAGLIAQAPPRLHVVLASRTAPPFPTQRLRLQDEVVELTGPELEFTVVEVETLAERALGPAAVGIGADLHRATVGWPAAVRLAIEAARGLPNPRAVLDQLGNPTGPLHAYLAEEVLGQEAPALRELLRQTSGFDPISVDLCDALGVPDPSGTLGDLVRRGLAVDYQEGWFSVHTLARDFARDAWPLAERERVALYTKAARWFETRGYFERALASFAEASDLEAIARLLRQNGRLALEAVGAESVVTYAALVPSETLGAEGEALLGEAHVLRGESDQALEHLLRAARGQPHPPAAVAWKLVAAHHLRDDLDAARAAYEAASLDDADPADAALLHAWGASAERRRGDHTAARMLADEALRCAKLAGDDRALALAHTACGLSRQGREHEGENHLALALAAAERAGDPFQCARIHNNHASQLLEEGLYRAAIDELEQTMQLAEVGGFTALLALATMNRGLCHWCLGRLDEARVDYEAAVEHYRRAGSDEEAYALVGLGDVHRERGDVAQARTRYEEGLTIAERTGDRQALVPALYQLAKVLVDDEPERAASLAERAVAYAWPDLPWALNARGWIFLAQARPEHAGRDGAAAARAARDTRDPFGLAESYELRALATADPPERARLLEEALAMWRNIGNDVHEAAVELALSGLASDSGAHRAAGRAQKRLRRLGVRIGPGAPAGILRFVAAPDAAPLSIETLGGLRVVREGIAVPATEWRSQKARDVLKILVSRRGAPTHRDLLMETLWPGVDPKRAANRLSVALSTARSVLDPSEGRDPDRYLRSDGDAVTLVLEHVVVDIEDFLAEAGEGLELWASGRPREARERLEHALALYRGDFLEEDAYEEWSLSLREEGRALHADAAHALAAEAREEGRPSDAARYCLRILDRDAYDERAHLQLVAALAAGGRHGEARRAYRAYCGRMEDIGVEPGPFPVQERTRIPL